MLNNPIGMKRDNSQAKFTAISRQVSPVSQPEVSAGYCKRALADESGMIRNQTGTQQLIRNGRSLWVALCDHPVTVGLTITVQNSASGPHSERAEYSQQSYNQF
jgi:hypothetical protein